MTLPVIAGLQVEASVTAAPIAVEALVEQVGSPRMMAENAENCAWVRLSQVVPVSTTGV
jgi:hypothetical protein